MTNFRYFAQRFFLNGIYVYLLFGFYALTLSPFIVRFIKYGEKNLTVAMLGFTMFIAEYFAFRFKLKMIRMRLQERKIAWKKENGTDIVPAFGPMIWFAFFMRLVFRLAFIMVAMTELGYPCTETKMSIPGMLVMFASFFIDFCGLLYINMSSGLFNDPYETAEETSERESEDEKWNKKNLPFEYSFENYWKEIVADIILQVYAFMLYTAFWNFTNREAIVKLHASFKNGDSGIGAAMQIFPMLFIIVLIGLMPVRIAYWIEDATMAFTQKEKLIVRITFILVAVITIAPSLKEFIILFVIK